MANVTENKAVNKQDKSSPIAYEDFDLESNIGFIISDVHRLMTAVIDKVMAPLGLTRSQLRVLLFLIRHDGYTQVELAENLGIGKVAIGGLLDRLEEKELLERKSHPDDRRAKRVFLTAKVASLFEPMAKLSDGLMDQLLTDITDKEHAELLSNLNTLKNNCQRILADD